MSAFRQQLAAQLWWRPQPDITLLSVNALFLTLGAGVMLWLHTPLGKLGLILLLGATALLIFLSVGRIPEIAHSEAFALLPARTSRLRSALLTLIVIAALACTGIGLFSQRWQMAIGLFLTVTIMLTAFSVLSRQKRGAEAWRLWLILMVFGVLPVIGIGFAAKHHHQAPGLIALLLTCVPLVYALCLLTWRMHALGRWQVPRGGAPSNWLLGLNLNSQASFVCFSQLILCALIMSRNSFGSYYLVSILPTLTLSLVQPAMLRDTMSRHWLGGMPRADLWRPALRLAWQLGATNLVLLLAGLELCKWLPWAHAQSLLFGQIALLCGYPLLVLWQLVQLGYAPRARDAYWWGFNTAELPGFGPVRTTRSLRRLLSVDGLAYFGGSLCTLGWIVGSTACMAIWGDEPGHFALAMFAYSALLSLLALPFLRSSLRRIEL
ncbi:hypothetical protein [Uliginosibacterium sediminicola]|uniref:ABC transporter permease n=1 Tax=Uliginosibacterium sediminicola TaxID=2024550 RepID=A0ABU9YYM0_9RHOO